MAILEQAEGCLAFDVLETEPRLSLQSFEDYIDSLNDLDLAPSLINKYGVVTSPDNHGVFVRKNNNKLGIMLGQEFNSVVYRGQCNDYPFMPSSQRYELFDGNERIRHSVEWIKKNEFIRLIKCTPYYNRMQSFEVLGCNFEFNMEAVAKHYNQVSDYIDFTKNMMVAYFFAYTYWDKDKNQYLPIENFEYNNPCLYIGSLKEIYYRKPECMADMSFQTLLRAKAQQSIPLNVSEDRDYIKSLFKKVELPKNPEIARNVYEQFDGGKRLFPPDYASKYSYLIQNRKTLQEDLVEKYCEITETDEEWLRSEYEELGYELTEQSQYISEQAICSINTEIDDYILPYLNSKFLSRSVNSD